MDEATVGADPDATITGPASPAPARVSARPQRVGDYDIESELARGDSSSAT